MTTLAPVRRRVEHVMGMPVSLAVRGGTDDLAVEHAWETVLDDLRRSECVFSTYRSGSWVSRLGRGEVRLEDCPPEVAEVLALGERARVESGGAFDVRRGGVLDPSGVVKGWAVQRASAHLASLPSWCLSAGGDMVCHAAPGDAPWRIGIEDPHDPARVLAVVPVRRGAVATSGTAHRGAHVVDARSGLAPVGLASVTVVAPDLVQADLDATSAFALGPGAEAWLRTRPGHAVVVRDDGSAVVVDGA